MRAVIQRVANAQVTVEGEVVGSIGPGLLALVAAIDGDAPEDAAWLEHKLLSLRIFEDDAGKMNRSVLDVGGSILVVSQLTLAANIGKGARPSFMAAMKPDAARLAIDGLLVALGKSVPVATGRFGASMRVELVNAGPVTLWLDSNARSAGE